MKKVKKNSIDIVRFGWTLSLAISLFYIVDFIWGFTLPVDVQTKYMELLSIAYIGFTGFDVLSFILGLIQVFIWGWVIAGIFGGIWNKLGKK